MYRSRSRAGAQVLGALMLCAVCGGVDTTLAEEESQTVVQRQVEAYLNALAERRCQDLFAYWAGAQSFSDDRKKEEIKYCRKSTRRTKILEWTTKSVVIDGTSADVVVEVKVKTYVGWFRRETCWEGWQLRLHKRADDWLVDPSAGRTFRVAEVGCDE